MENTAEKEKKKKERRKTNKQKKTWQHCTNKRSKNSQVFFTVTPPSSQIHSSLKSDFNLHQVSVEIGILVSPSGNQNLISVKIELEMKGVLQQRILVSSYSVCLFRVTLFYFLSFFLFFLIYVFHVQFSSLPLRGKMRNCSQC